MKKHLLFLLVAISFASCQDDTIMVQSELQSSEIDSRAAYDSGYVEWDNVDNLAYKNGSDAIQYGLPLPWEPGSSASSGIPGDWIDQNLRDPNPLNRYYSQANGWIMVYNNLLEHEQGNKYFALYNKNTGIFRMFFYAIESSSGVGTSGAFMGLKVSESSSLLNFSFSSPLAMDEPQTNATTFYFPVCEFSGNNIGNREGYKANQWYGMEVELAYETNSQNNNRLRAKLGGINITNTQTTGSSTGNIKGNIQTTYSNTPSFNLNFTSNTNHNISSTLNLSYNDAKDEIVAKIENGVSSNSSFFKDLWNGIKKDFPSIASSSIKDGISSILDSGTSLGTKLISRLAKKVLGVSSGPMTATSKVELGIGLDFSGVSTSETEFEGWGNITDIPLPGTTFNNQLYNEKLGVWNIASRPTVYADMYAYSYFWPEELAPNQPKPRAYEIDFRYTLIPCSLVVNPVVLQNFNIANVQQKLVCNSSQYNYMKNTPIAYGLNGNMEVYNATDGTIQLERVSDDFVEATYNPQTNYGTKWNFGLSQLEPLYCHFSFDLVAKDGSKTYSFSKYFAVKAAYQRNFYHEERIIDRDTDIGTFSIEINEEYQELVNSSRF